MAAITWTRSPTDQPPAPSPTSATSPATSWPSTRGGLRLGWPERQILASVPQAEQLLHGEPHPGNVLTTKNGLLFIDLETCCRGPVEFDLAHAPEEVGEHYPGINQDLLRECRILVLAMITTWRWDRGDQFPNGRQLGTEWLSQTREALDRNGLAQRQRGAS